MAPIDIQLKDFQLRSEWVIPSQEQPRHVIDQSTGRKYTALKTAEIRLICLLASLVGPTFTALINGIFRVIALIVGFHFWWRIEPGKSYNLKERALHACIDLAATLATPITVLVLELAALYGLVSPRDGRKLYASTERLGFKYVAIPSFQPQDLSHPVLNIWS